MKDENLEMFLCVIHKENLVDKNVSSVLNDIIKSVIKFIEANGKLELLNNQFWEEC